MSEVMDNSKKSQEKSKIFLLVIICIISGAAYWQWTMRFLESTNDAFAETNLVYLTPRISGVMISLDVKDNQFIRKGAIIARVDPASFNAEVDAAQANVEAAIADLSRVSSESNAFITQLRARRLNAIATIQVAKQDSLLQEAELKTLDAQIQQSQREVKRYQQLQAKHQVSRQLSEESQTQLETLQTKRGTFQVSQTVANAKLEAARTSSEIISADEQQVFVFNASKKQAEASLNAAKAQLKTAQLHLLWTTIKAPHDGWISKISARPGSQLSPSKAMGILVFGKPWIDANFKETQIGRIRIGDPVDIEMDALEDIILKGHIDSFQAGTGARFSLLPPENATGNFVKVVQRLPIKIVIDTPLPDTTPLWPGLSAKVTVDVSNHEQASR